MAGVSPHQALCPSPLPLSCALGGGPEDGAVHKRSARFQVAQDEGQAEHRGHDRPMHSMHG